MAPNYTLEEIKEKAKEAARRSKPLIHPILWTVTFAFFVCANIGLMATTGDNPGFQVFFNSVFAIIVIGAFIGGYIHDATAKWFVKDLEKILRERLAQVYYRYEMTWDEAVSLAAENVKNYRFESIIEYIEYEERN